jgi:hypothetical protein
VLREVKGLRAVGEQRGVSLREIEPPGIQLHQGPNELRRHLPLPGCEPDYIRKELFIREVSKKVM